MKTLAQIYDIFLSCDGISTDTRKITTNSMFFALKGENFNGNKFATEALTKGAKYVIVDEVLDEVSEEISVNSNHEKYILVENVLETLQQLATYHRKQFKIPFIAIVGSNGKTTTKELIKAVLSKKYRTYATTGNFNNHIGVPITLLNMPKDTEIAVIEMGANRLGDNAELCGFVAPTHGVATNVGHDHLEGFGTIENVFSSQTELYEFLLKNDGIVVANSADFMLGNAVRRRFKTENIRWYGSESDFLHLKLVAVNPFVLYEDDEKHQVQTQLIGAYNLPNIMVALAFGKLFDVPLHLAHDAVVSYVPTNNRSQLIEKNGYHIISDAYNANPSSMVAALENLAAIESPYKTAIIGDMFEMGEESILRHSEVMEVVKKLIRNGSIDQILVCGKDFYDSYISYNATNNKPFNTIIKDGVEKFINLRNLLIYFKTKAELQTWLAANKLPKGYILLKASRGIGLETVLESL